MVRNLLATTALAGLLATGALAQGTTPPAAETRPSPGAAPQAETAASAKAAGFDYLTQLSPDQHLSENLVGSPVYLSSGESDEEVADIADLVVAADGTVLAVVLTTGSALGAQPREVAVPFDRFDWVRGENGDIRARLTANPDEIASASAFIADGDPQAGATPAPVDPAASGEVAADAAQGGSYLATLQPEQYLAGDLIGNDVYAGPTRDTDKIGSMDNLVVSTDGTLAGVVVGVGGFLGIGEKEVGVPFDAIAFSDGEDGEQHAALAVTREELEAAPEFEAGAAPAPRMAAAQPAVDGTAAAVPAQAASAAGSEAMPGMVGETAGALEAAVPPAAASPASAMTPVEPGELTAEGLIGTSVHGPNNETIGTIGNIALGSDGAVDAVIVDVGGFLGIGAKPVAVSMENLNFLRDRTGAMSLFTSFTQEQLESAREFDEATFAENRDTMLVETGQAR